LRLCRRRLLGIFSSVAKGQTRRKTGTQSHRSKAMSHDSGVAGKAQVFSKKGFQGIGTRDRGAGRGPNWLARALDLLRCLPIFQG
jgi:hypothetical protein